MVYKVTGYQNDTTMTVQPISYSSASYKDAVTNTTNSTMKNTLDTWYKNNLTSYASYLADETFCSDRKINWGNGYLTTPTTTYGAYGRLYEKRTPPSLKCAQDNDKFKVSNASAKLDYPISLITADEAAMAGGVYNTPNSNYYLYNGQYFWTLSPSYFESYTSHAYVWAVQPSGGLDWNNVASSFGARPVINLKADTLITKGDGTALNPFKIEI